MASSLTEKTLPDAVVIPAEEFVRAEATFVPGGDLTVGCEDELILVGEDHQLSAEDSAGVVAATRAACPPGSRVTPELFASMIEFATPVCRDGGEVRTSLAGLRGTLASAGGRALGTGVHPAGPFGQARLTEDPRYAAIGASLRGLLRTPTAALQVHVGMRDAEEAVLAYRGLRHRVALLRALAANSPYWHGQDSGFASARWAVINSYPRVGAPPVARSWDEYRSITATVCSAGEVPDHTYLWWDLRLQPQLGTVEVRVMDAQTSLDTVAGLVALAQGLAQDALERPAPVDIPGEVLAENDLRTARSGLEARIVDVDGVMRPVRLVAADALCAARSTLGDSRADALVAIERLLTEEPEYSRQRRLHDTLGMPALLGDLAGRTLQ